MQLNVIAFPGAPNLPLFAAQEHRCFTGEGLDVHFETTPSSVFQFSEFAAGRFDIAFTAFDNVVAYREGQGAAKLDTIPDFRAVMGCTQIELSLVVAPEIQTVGDLRSKSLALDAVGTGFAFVLYEMLARMGLQRSDYEVAPVGATPERWRSVKAGEHAGTITIEPFTSLATAAGFRVLTRSSDHLDAYQGGVIAVRRNWAVEHDEVLSTFLSVYRRSLAWVLDPANREAAAAILAARMPEVQPKMLDAVMTSLLDPRSGLTPGGAILREGAGDGARPALALRPRRSGPDRGGPLSRPDLVRTWRLFERLSLHELSDNRT